MIFGIPVLLSLTFFAGAPQAKAEVLDRIIAVVNDDILTESDVTEFEKRLRSGSMVDDLLSEDPKALLKDRAALIDHMINERVIDTEVRRKNLAATVEKVEQEISKIAARNHVARKQLKQALKEQGVDFAEYQDFVKKRLERQSLIEQAVTSKVKISDDEVAAFYLSQKKGSGKETFEYSLAHILFLPDNKGDVALALKQAQAVLEKSRSGESFETLAAKYSEDPNFASGGLLGTFKSGEFVKELDEAAGKMNPGDVAGPIRSKLGIHLLKVLTKKLSGDPELERQKENIRGFLLQKAFKKQFSFWLDQRRRESFIRINAR